MARLVRGVLTGDAPAVLVGDVEGLALPRPDPHAQSEILGAVVPILLLVRRDPLSPLAIDETEGQV